MKFKRRHPRTWSEFRAQEVLKKRAIADAKLLGITRKYEASLEMAAKKCIEALKHLEPYSIGHKQTPRMLKEAKQALFLAIQFLVKSGVTDPRRPARESQKRDPEIQKAISGRKKLENDNL